MPGANDPSNPFPKVKTQYTIDKTFGGWDSAAMSNASLLVQCNTGLKHEPRFSYALTI